MTDHDALLAAIEQDPENQTILLVFADWLGEHNDPREEGYREMARMGFSPCFCKNANGWCFVGTMRNVDYVHSGNPIHSGNPSWNYCKLPKEHCLLPDPWYRFLEGKGDCNIEERARVPRDFIWQYFSSVRLAVDSCALAYAELQSAALPMDSHL